MLMRDELLELHAGNRKGRRWSEGDDALLRRCAGKMDLGQIAGMLHRSVDSVRKRANMLRIDYRCPRPTLMLCPRCGEWRTELAGGVCRVCRKRDTRDALERRERALLDEMDAAYRERSLSRRRVEPMRPRRKGLDPAALEALQCRMLDRENATRRRRCERMEEAMRSRCGDDV